MTRQLALVGESGFGGNEGKRAAGFYQRLRLAYTPLLEVTVRRYPAHSAKHPREVEGPNADVRRQFVEGHVGTKMGIEILGRRRRDSAIARRLGGVHPR